MAAVIGDPVEHSLSPVLHNAAFSALDLDWIYVAFRVVAGHAGAALEAMRTLDLAGLSVTMPHKEAVARAVDRLGPVAATLGVANTVRWSPGSPVAQLVGESTDGAGYLDALRGDEGFDPKGRRCVVLGAGGAARSVCLALAAAGASSVAVAARRAEAAASCARLAGPAGCALAPGPAALEAAVREADLLINATPTGMRGGDGLPMDMPTAWLRAALFVSDLVYAPAITPLLAAARAIGAPHSNGLGMLVHQAGRQVELWTGRPPPLEAMSAAAVAAMVTGTS